MGMSLGVGRGCPGLVPGLSRRAAFGPAYTALPPMVSPVSATASGWGVRKTPSGVMPEVRLGECDGAVRPVGGGRWPHETSPR